MGDVTRIGWTDHTFNPWIGCARVSAGCQHCYAERDFGQGGRHARVEWGVSGTRSVTSDGYWRQPLKWNRDAEQQGRTALVFCASLADVFEDRRDLDEHRARLFELIAATPWLIWQLLTKRPERVLDLVPDEWRRSTELTLDGQVVHHPSRWPENVWIGTTIEDQRAADVRLPELDRIPAPVRFLSCEPLLGPLSLLPWLSCPPGCSHEHCGDVPIDWVIVGGESGPGHRPFDPRWAEALRVECAAADVPFYFKQHGGMRPQSNGDLLFGRRWHEFPTVAGVRW